MQIQRLSPVLGDFFHLKERVGVNAQQTMQIAIHTEVSC